MAIVSMFAVIAFTWGHFVTVDGKKEAAKWDAAGDDYDYEEHPKKSKKPWRSAVDLARLLETVEAHGGEGEGEGDANITDVTPSPTSAPADDQPTPLPPSVTPPTPSPPATPSPPVTPSPPGPPSPSATPSPPSAPIISPTPAPPAIATPSPTNGTAEPTTAPTELEIGLLSGVHGISLAWAALLAIAFATLL